MINRQRVVDWEPDLWYPRTGRVDPARRGVGADGSNPCHGQRKLSFLESRLSLLLFGAALAFSAGCGVARDGQEQGWSGTLDTLPSGQILVTNRDEPIWLPGEQWLVVEEMRIGRADGEGPDLFGRIGALEVDGGGRLWVLDEQAQELRVFTAAGEYVRTVGRRGRGPGEFAQAIQVDLGPDGNIWVMDRANARLSVFDTAGKYTDAKRVPGGFLIRFGGFDMFGRYYEPFPRIGIGGEMSIVMLRHNASFTSVDTIELPRDPVKRTGFEVRNKEGGRLAAGAPFQGRLLWRLSRHGTIWVLITDQYRLVELEANGDTLRTVSREFSPLPVTEADRTRAREELKWFTQQGGQIDWSKVPDSMPLATDFFLDDEDGLWVAVPTAQGESGRQFQIFDRVGRYMGDVQIPFAVSRFPRPIFRRGMMYAVTHDASDVPHVVVARIVKR